MKKNISFLSVFIALLALQLFSHGCSPREQKAVQKKMLSEAALFQAAVDLVAAEADYFRARKKGDWKEIYAYQSAYYRQKVSPDEFIFYGGKMRPDWKENAHISGKKMEIPPPEKMREIIEKKQPQYKILESSGVISVKETKFELDDQIRISPDGRHGRVVLKASAMIIFSFLTMSEMHISDFFDFEYGQWRVQQNRWDYVPISGMRKPPGPDIQYKIFSLKDIINYRLRRADVLYAQGRREEAREEYWRAVELNPLELYRRAPVEDPEVRECLKEIVLEEIDEWNSYLEAREKVDNNAISQGAWTPEQVAAKREELEEIRKFFNP